MSKKKTIDIESLGVNPFSFPLVIEVTKVIEKVNGGEHSHNVDRVPHTKLFNTVIAREQRALLSGMGWKLFSYIVDHIEPNEDYIKIDPESFREYMSVKSLKSYYDAVKDLQYHGIISAVAGKKCLYWINPAVLFKGDRSKKFPEKVVVKQVFRKS